MWNRKNKGLSSSQKLENLLSEIELLARSDDYRDNKAILYIIKIYTDYINLSRNIQLLQNDKLYSIFDDILLDGYISKPPIEQSFYIDLGKFPVITNIWNRDRQIKNLSCIGCSNTPWKEDVNNHFMKLILPMGVLLVYNGNHSVNSGVIKSIGKIEVSSHKTNIKVYDISCIYPKICFNGTAYIDIKTKKIISEAPFEYGCIFEMGRIINKYKIDILNLYNSQI